MDSPYDWVNVNGSLLAPKGAHSTLPLSCFLDSLPSHSPLSTLSPVSPRVSLESEPSVSLQQRGRVRYRGESLWVEYVADTIGHSCLPFNDPPPFFLLFTGMPSCLSKPQQHFTQYLLGVSLHYSFPFSPFFVN